jgi:hypothetical protein
MEITFFTAVEIRPVARLVFASLYPDCAGITALWDSPYKIILRKRQQLPNRTVAFPGLYARRFVPGTWFLHGISAYDNPVIKLSSPIPIAC